MKLLSLLTLTVQASAFAAIAAGKSRPGSSLIHPSKFQLKSTSATSTETNTGGDATMAATTFNIAKSIIGAGVLSLPSGVAFFADKPSALIPAGIMTFVMGLVAAYSYSLIGKACSQHNAKSFQEVWEKSADPKTAWIISGGITAQCFLASLAYSIIIGDSFTSIAQSFKLPAMLASRNNIITFFSVFVLYPLCSLKSLNALAPFSLLGLLGTLYTAVFMAIRYYDKSYAVGGAFYGLLSAAAKPSFDARVGYALNHMTLILVSMLSTSYIAHFNAPKFYSELKNTSMTRFNKVVNSAFGVSIVTFIFMMSMGFLTFGGACNGFVLNNYASSDLLASFARLAIGLALVTGFPFTFSALRDGILDLAKCDSSTRVTASQPLTIGFIGLLTALAIALKDVGFVVSISGALFGSAIMFIVPAIMNLNNSRKPLIKANGEIVGKIGKFESIFNHLMMVSGVVMGGLGVIISVLREMGKL